MYEEEWFDLSERQTAKKQVPVERIMERLVKLENKDDCESAITHLEYWVKEARGCGDLQAEFTLTNELTGLYRKTGREKEAVAAAGQTLAVGEKLGITESEAYGTALINAATVYKAFGQSEKALPLFLRAEKIIRAVLSETHPKTGGLYNNMALCLADLNKFDDAENAYKKAIGIMLANPGGRLEAAISELNLASMYEKRYGLEQADTLICDCLDQAEKLLEQPLTENEGYYAFVCSKCAPVFDYYGRFAFAAEIAERAEKIYRRNGKV